MATKLIYGDALALMENMPARSFDAVITDPPYCSGGLNKRANHKGNSKYVAAQYTEFDDGATRDQMAHFFWTREWLSRARRITKKRGYLIAFSDWRQLPLLMRAASFTGWTLQGVFTWAKCAGRPFLGQFRRDTEFALVATNGTPLPFMQSPVKKSPSAFLAEPMPPTQKLHCTSKPIKLMQHLMEVLPPNSSILDPFCGSGTTLVAAERLGHNSTGIECVEDIFKLAQKRIAEESNQLI